MEIASLLSIFDSVGLSGLQLWSKRKKKDWSTVTFSQSSNIMQVQNCADQSHFSKLGSKAIHPENLCRGDDDGQKAREANTSEVRIGRKWHTLLGVSGFFRRHGSAWEESATWLISERDRRRDWLVRGISDVID